MTDSLRLSSLLVILGSACGENYSAGAPDAPPTQVDAHPDGGQEFCAPGSGPTELARGQGIRALAPVLGETDVYWFEITGDSGGIRKVPKSGGTMTTLAEGIGPTYFINGDAFTAGSASVFWAADNIYQVPAAGGAAQSFAIMGTESAVDLTADSGAVYWITDKSVVRKGFGDPNQGVALAVGEPSPVRLNVDDTSVYWVTCSRANTPPGTCASTVKRVPTSGGAPSELTSSSGLRPPFALDVDATSVYWMFRDPSFLTNIVKIPKGGGAPDPVVVADGEGFFMAIDESNIYWASWIVNPGTWSVRRVSKTGGASTTLPITISSSQGLNGLAVDATCLYWTDGTAIMKMRK